MVTSLIRVLTGVTLVGLAAALPAPSATVQADLAQATVTITDGTVIGSTLAGVESFGGIPFAEPPVGALRLKPPVRLNTSFGTLDATGSGPSCPQMLFSTDGNELLTSVLGYLLDTPLFQIVSGETEDCLTMRVQRPVGTEADAKLPVLFWIFGGGFELGSPQTYDATGLILNGVGMGKPFIFVAVNYRVGGFGFMPGKEILADGSANLGLLDQRMGLEWVADNVAAFGGDPDKVTIWGESAGAISVFDQMALYNGNNTYNGKPLFRAGIMDSGSVIPADAVDCPKGQVVYDTVVEEAGCSGAEDTLECLRSADYDTFLNAANSVPGIFGYNSVALSYVPRPDGTALTLSPDALAINGQYAAVPMIIGDQEDEGTLFSLFQSNITDTDLLVDYLSAVFFHDATRELIEELVAIYPDDPSAGSPFNTGILNNAYPEFKRLAAILGDLTFTLTRRVFLAAAIAANPDVPAWSYLASYDYGTPILGTFHASDILQVFYGILPDYASAATQSYYISFLYDLDPNSGNGNFSEWPQWNEGQQLVQFTNTASTVIDDDFRSNSSDFITANRDSLHI
ncbi:putative extracellular lipase [Xylariales sp. AK1849]|nr:putative extracellular lipase [Xylariales sp. AK1849]